MEKQKKLSHTAYGGCKGEDYVPFVSSKTAMPETTAISLAIGVLFAIIFAAANTYLGIKVGLTIAAGIPGAILGTGLLKAVFRRNNILEANMIASMAAMGESISGGIIFTLPAIILWGMKLDLQTIVIVTCLGGLLGVFFVTPLRQFLIVEEHGKLSYPESMAAAEVLVSGSEGGDGFKTVMFGLIGGAMYKMLAGGIRLIAEEPEWVIKPMQGTIFGFNNVASLMGVGFIVGLRASVYMFAGSLLAWLGIIPLIKYVGSGLAVPLFPSTKLISEMNAWEIWSKYIRYIGAGAVATGGFISLAKSTPTIIKSFKSAMSGIGGGETGTAERHNLDAPITWVIASAILVFVLTLVLPIASVKVGFFGAIMIIVFSFFFSVVSARMVGLIGASNNPVSGMTIATLLFATSILKACGFIGEKGMLAAIIVGGIVCVAIAVAGGTAQSLKTTYVIGGTPKNVQIGMYLALAVASVAAGAVVLMINDVYIIGSAAAPAPQAGLMSMVVKGVMTGELPWALVTVGVIIAVFCELAKLPILPIALGLYLPIHLNASILVGGIVRVFVEKKFKKEEEQQKLQVEKGILLASGLVAGDALMGILIAAFTTLGINIAVFKDSAIAQSSFVAAVVFMLLGLWIYKYSTKVTEKSL
ncbi:OPT family oligopeptide transporter [Oceanirhabdus sp. W0125-5]|uniref:OPT family oligopeptide transporter n=1 Tax=Oceanirhabdus sp. W0125-5 TaxID=2999116 RepID=UPI0022F2DFD2|nr:oligopeptide transporter, OPT family [Oceanirhabdus sp. W0125-5]WBW99060.1 oligopeptide transporter, OPT family [Oceanirhabdus sp. W0125-5]